MTRWLGLCLLVYAPHLVEEAFMLALALGMTFLVSLGGRARVSVMAALAFALVCESHHAVRALATLQYDSGLVTSLPMPIVGVLLMRKVFS